MPVITLRRADTCRDCGAELPAGSRARYYGRGRIYGTTCHEQGDEVIEHRRANGGLAGTLRDPAEDQADRWNEAQR